MLWFLAAAAAAGAFTLLPNSLKRELLVASMQPLGTVLAAALIIETVKSVRITDYSIKIDQDEDVMPSRVWGNIGEQLVRRNVRGVSIVKNTQRSVSPFDTSKAVTNLKGPLLCCNFCAAISEVLCSVNAKRNPYSSQRSPSLTAFRWASEIGKTPRSVVKNCYLGSADFREGRMRQ